MNTEEFIEEGKKIHGDKDEFTKTVYEKSLKKVIITCKKHGDYEITPNNYLSGHRCPKCSKYRNRYSNEEFIQKANEVHNFKYIYDKLNYEGQGTKICIICPEHGEFWQWPRNHLQGKGCPTCAKRHRYTTSEIVDEFKYVHGDKYDYSKVDYHGIDAKVCIICPEHGEFWQSPWNHIHNKQNCPKCSHRSYKYTTEEWVNKAKQISSNACIDFSNTIYVNNKTKIKAICPKHGEFYADPIYISTVGGCPICKSSKLEISINELLCENKLNFERQKKFDWLGKQTLDFYLPDYNVAIECQGEQHFVPVDFAGKGEEWAKKHFKRTLELDSIKKKLCDDNNVKLVYFSNKKYDCEIITDKEELLKEIKND